MLQCLKSINFIAQATSNIKQAQDASHSDIFNFSLLIAVLPGIGQIKLNSLKRIGPHNIDILSLIIGSTLGDSHLEKRAGGLGTRVIFEQSNKNVEYLM